MLIPVIYITIDKDSITLLNAKNGKSTTVTGNFSNERLAIANFTEAADAIKKGLFEVYPKSIFRVFPHTVIEPLYASGSPISEAEKKLLQLLVLSAGSRKVSFVKEDNTNNLKPIELKEIIDFHKGNEESILSSKSKFYFIVIFLSYLIISLTLLAKEHIHNTSKGKSGLFISDFASFGDSFGIMTCIFSGFAAIFLADSLRLQKSEFKSIREQAIDQAKTQQFQRFDNTFFSLINILNSQISSVVTMSFSGTISSKGNEAINIILHKLHDDNPIQRLDKEENPAIKYENKSNNAYSSSKKLSNSLKRISQYHDIYSIYKIMISLLELIDNNKENIEEEQRYVGILKAQTSDSLLVIFIYIDQDIKDNRHSYLFKKFKLFNLLDESKIREDIAPILKAYIN